jgi:hypothetical protein
MKKGSVIITSLIVLGFLVFFTIPFQSCQQKSTEAKNDTIILRDTIFVHDTIVLHDTIIQHDNSNCNNSNNYNNINNNNSNIHVARKPNIYIYPEKEISLKVNIDFPQDGNIITSIPSYNDGWDINVDPTGKINTTYNYLFYESIQPNKWQYDQGWIIEKDSLKEFFQNNMSEYGFNENEIKDFTEYWIPELTSFNYYLIYPQETEKINELIRLSFSVQPDNIFRLFYAIKGTNEKKDMDKPVIPNKLSRNGFHIIEWGVVIKEPLL